MRARHCLPVVLALLVGILLVDPAGTQEMKQMTPADGHDIHVVAPHVVEGVVMGPYHLW